MSNDKENTKSREINVVKGVGATQVHMKSDYEDEDMDYLSNKATEIAKTVDDEIEVDSGSECNARTGY